MTITKSGNAGLLAAFALAACVTTAPKAPENKFVEDRPIAAPKFVDFAQLEYSTPLSLEERARLMPKDLKGLDQESIDQIYARLTAGPIPDGPYKGEVFVTSGTRGNFEVGDTERTPENYGVDDLVWGYLRKMLAAKGASIKDAAQELWKGKDFVPKERILRNRIASLEPLRLIGLVEGNPGQAVDAKGWELFPAKLYCGQSLLDSRRESIVIDYLFTDELPGYQEKPDLLAGRRGLQVRDEIRMVRPGFYLGRAYVNRIFLLTFTLYNEEVDKRDTPEFMRTGPAREDCWTGTQARRTSG